MLRFCDSFDHYGTADFGLKWVTTQANSPAIASGGRTNNCLQLTIKFFSTVVLTRALDNQTTWILGVAVKWNKGFATGILSLYDGTTRQISVAVNRSGQVYIDKNGTNLAASTNIWVDGWNYVELKAVFNSGTPSAGTVAVHVNNASWVSYTGNISQSGNQYANTVAIGDFTGDVSSPTSIYFDDFYACDGQGSLNNDFLNDVTVDALMPNGAGNYSNFAAVGAASNYLCVNENPTDGDTHYVTSATVGDRDSYQFTDINNTASAIKGVQLVIDSRKTGGATRAIGTFVRISGTDYDQTGVNQATSYSDYLSILETNPATSVAWTTSDITSFEAGPKVTA